MSNALSLWMIIDYKELLWYVSKMNGPLRQITIQQLESLFHLVEEGSFSRAAKKMRLTQPSLSKHIQNMEYIVGSRVVERRNTGIEVTAEGKVLLDCAKRIFRHIGEAEEHLSRLQLLDSGTITIAASTIPATYLLPPVLSAFRQVHSDICCFVHTGDSGAVIDSVLEGESELGFVGKEVKSRKLVAEPLWEDEIILVVPARHPWSGRREVSWDEVTKEPFVMRERGSATRASLETHVEETVKKGLGQFNVVCELGSSEAVKEAVAAGLGVSILSIHAVKRELDAGILSRVALPAPFIERNFYLIYKKQFTIKRHHALFLKFLEKQKPLRGRNEG